MLPYDRKLRKVWRLDQIIDIQLKSYMLKMSAVEVQLLEGSTLFFNFERGDNERLVEQLLTLRGKQCVNLKKRSKNVDNKKYLERTKFQKKWKNGEISNFEYLMVVNATSGRSYRDVMQYPVFPWVFNDYETEMIDLGDERYYRDVTKNMGSYGKADRIAQYIERFNGMDPSGEIPPFHYGSHFSSPAIVFQFLIRVQPYNEGARLLQGGRYDLADRLFYSTYDSYKCATEDMQDIRELIPEMFCNPEIFINVDQYDFGTMQNGRRVHDVQLPLWCREDPYRFVYMLRKGLESSFIGQGLNQWIDLVFGYRQRGIEAVKALNVFYYLTYDDQVSMVGNNDEGFMKALEVQIINFGQTPIQVLTKPHPPRQRPPSLFRFQLYLK